MSESEVAYLQKHDLPQVVNAMLEDMLLDRPTDVYRWMQAWAAGKGAPALPNTFADLLTPCVWSLEEHGTDLVEVDHQHVKLFRLINQLSLILRESMKLDSSSSLAGGVPYRQLLPIAQELRAYTEYHFAEEESHFVPTAYPKKDEHMAKHRAFEKRFVRFLEGIENERSSVNEVVQVLKFLKDWLVSHIKTVDREYLEYLPREMHVYDIQADTALTLPRKKRAGAS